MAFAGGGALASHRTGQEMTISLKVNGSRRSVPAEADTPLLYVLRNDLALNGAKFGCGLAQCGACTVLIDGRAARSCVTEIGAIGDAEITTIEGLGTVDKPHPLQRAFIDEQAAQCGYCINGMIMTAKDLLDHNPRPTATALAAAASPSPSTRTWRPMWRWSPRSKSTARAVASVCRMRMWPPMLARSSAPTGSPTRSRAA